MMSSTEAVQTHRHTIRRHAATAVIAIAVMASAARAAEPPPCDERNLLSKVKNSYSTLQEMANATMKFKVGGARELGYGPPPKGVNQYAPSRDYYSKSRHCQATITLANGTTEPAYYRIDGRKEPGETDYNFDVCFPKFDSFKEDCKRVRPGG